MIVGYSMGAALALIVEKPGAVRPALALLAPFSWPEPCWLPPVEFAVRPFLPIGFRPMRRADFGNPQVRQGIEKFMPGIDLDDPAVRGAMRDFRVPLGLIDQIRGVSRQALRAAPDASVPVLVVQGRRGTGRSACANQALIGRLPRQPAYVEVDSDHNLTDAQQSGLAGGPPGGARFRRRA